MGINRVTNNMMMNRSYSSIQAGLARLSKTTEQLTTGKVLNRPSDSPTETTSAMRIRSSLADQTQYARNAEDGVGRLGIIDSTLQGMLTQLTRSRDLGIQAVNGTNMTTQSREALASEVDQLREGLIAGANTTYLGRPIFGGLVNGNAAYDAAGSYIGVLGPVERAIAKGIKVDSGVDGPATFGATGASIFDNLADLADAIRAGDIPGIKAQQGNLNLAQDRVTSTLSDVGTKYARMERAAQAAKDASLALMSALSTIEDVDIPRAMLDQSMQEVSYKAALSSTAKLVQPSLSDFLR